MCSATGVAILQAGAGLNQAQAQINEGSRQNKYYRYMASLKDTEAEMVKATGRRQTRAIQDNAGQQSKDLNDELKRVQGSQRVALAASGVGAGSASAEDVAMDTINRAKADELAIRFNADRSSEETLRMADFEAMNLRNEASGMRAAGRNAKSAAGVNAFSTLLSSATQVADTWYQHSQTQVTPKKDSNYVPDYSGKGLNLKSQAPGDPRQRRAGYMRGKKDYWSWGK